MGKTHLHRPCLPALLISAVGTIVDDLIARERNPETSQLDGGIYLFVWGVSTGLPTNFGGALHREHRSIVRPVEIDGETAQCEMV